MANTPNCEDLKQKIEKLERDFLQRNHAESLLKQALKDTDLERERFRTVVANSPFGIALISKDGTFTHINPKFKELFGYDEEDLPNGKEWFRKAYPDPEYRHSVIATWLKDAAGAKAGEKRPRVFRVICKYGEEKAVNFISVTLTSGENIVACEDITERKRSEKALRDSEEKYRTILENIEDGYYEVDIAGNLTFFNESVCRLLGYSPNEMKGMNNRHFTDDENARKIYQAFNAVHRSGVPAKGFDWEIIRKDGTKRFIESSISLIRSDSDAPVGFRGVVRDVTERKNLESQLRQAQKMEAIGTLAGGIAHDFNNLLQAINGYTQLLLWGKSENEPGHSELKEIEKAAGRAASLVRQLLAFSRKVAGQRRPLNLNQEVMDIEKVLKRTIPKMIELRVRPGKNLWAVQADPIQIEQIMLNLGSNAADAMPDGGSLTIQTKNVDLDEDFCRNHLGATPGKYVLLTISDTGHGMDRETMQHIFEPFFTTKEIGKGNGLGLASVYGIVKSYGGYILCYSEVGQGSTFRIYLPAVEQGEGDSADRVEVSPPKGGDETILVVEDESSIRDFAAKILHRFGYHVILAKSGEEALELFASQRDDIDLVILDLGMPGMGGYACLHELLKLAPSVKVMIASGYAIDARMNEALQSGAAGYVGKPYQFRELLEKVRAILDGRKHHGKKEHRP